MKQNRFFVLRVSALLLIFALVLAGCDTGNGGGGGDDDTNKIANPTSPSIVAKFGIDVTVNSTAKVTEAFTALHAYLATGPAVSGADATLKLGDIALGDYIDLPSLTIGADTITDQHITPASLPYDGYDGRLLRLIVVGINSFNPSGFNTPLLCSG